MYSEWRDRLFGVKYHAVVNTLINWQISKSNMVSHQTDQANLDMSPLLIDYLLETAKGYSISNPILYMNTWKGELVLKF